MPPGPLLEMRDVVRGWPGATAPVLRKVQLTVSAGEVVAVTGRNGAGKTTLLRVAAGLLCADAGTVRVAGRDPEAERRACQQRLGFLSAGNTGLYGRLTVERHLQFWSRLALLGGARRDRAVNAARERFDLGELRDRRVDRLSMGQRQRLRIALAFLHDPLLVLLDEPRTSLDDEGTALLAGAVAELAAAGGGAVVCSPAATDAGVAFDRAVAMQDGALVDA